MQVYIIVLIFGNSFEIIPTVGHATGYVAATSHGTELPLNFERKVIHERIDMPNPSSPPLEFEPRTSATSPGSE